MKDKPKQKKSNRRDFLKHGFSFGTGAIAGTGMISACRYNEKKNEGEKIIKPKISCSHKKFHWRLCEKCMLSIKPIFVYKEAIKFIKFMIREDVEKEILALQQTGTYLDGKVAKKVIVVPGKIINIVV